MAAWVLDPASFGSHRGKGADHDAQPGSTWPLSAYREDLKAGSHSRATSFGTGFRTALSTKHDPQGRLPEIRSAQLAAYQGAFGPGNVGICRTEMLQARTRSVFERLFRFSRVLRVRPCNPING